MLCILQTCRMEYTDKNVKVESYESDTKWEFNQVKSPWLE